ncbi:MAG: hypothetical protein KZQ91_13090 [Candidatus Thiodiazotropha sp. (ex Lucinoma borealis)]|nr:hypothetical protein [Candidatus Thiodiazotropha sp. (ex Lucinoma borealis)]
MCYMIIISTNSDMDLGKYNSDSVIFNREMPGLPEEIFLKYPNQWYVESAHGCSCGFRHLMACNFPDLGFAKPESWFEEEQEDIDATLKLVKVFKELVSKGSKLDCVDAWSGDEKKSHELSGEVVVNFSEISETEFRLIEDFQHDFIYET